MYQKLEPSNMLEERGKIGDFISALQLLSRSGNVDTEQFLVTRPTGGQNKLNNKGVKKKSDEITLRVRVVGEWNKLRNRAAYVKEIV